MALQPRFPAPTVRAPRRHDVFLMSDGRMHEYERQQAGRVLRILHEHYPGYAWQVGLVHPEFRQDALVIYNLTLDPRTRWGFFFRLTAIAAPDGDHKVVMAGGEYLERYNMMRAGLDEAAVAGRNMHFARPET
jgi:hypothetical protein